MILEEFENYIIFIIIASLNTYTLLNEEQNKKVAKMGGHAAKVARDDIEKNLGRSIVSKDNALLYKYINDELMIENKS